MYIYILSFFFFFYAENDVLDKVREKLVNIETDDLQQRDTKQRHDPQDSQQHHHHQSLHHHHRHLRRPLKSEEPQDTASSQRKWKKTKVILSRRPSTESESSDQSEAIPEIRVVRPATSGGGTNNELHTAVSAEGVKNRNHPATSVSHPPLGSAISSMAGEPGVGHGKTGGGPDGKHRARLKLAQILYKEARRRRQKYVEELQNQPE